MNVIQLFERHFERRPSHMMQHETLLDFELESESTLGGGDFLLEVLFIGLPNFL